MFLGNLKDSEIPSSKNTKIPRRSKLIQKYSLFIKNMFDLQRLTYVLGLSTIIQDLLRYQHRVFRCFWKTLGDTNGFGPKNIIIHFWSPPWFPFFQSLAIRTFYCSRSYKNPKFQNVLLCFIINLGIILAKLHS